MAVHGRQQFVVQVELSESLPTFWAPKQGEALAWNLLLGLKRRTICCRWFEHKHLVSAERQSHKTTEQSKQMQIKQVSFGGILSIFCCSPFAGTS